jgi:SAM-dependent methyltransferase
MTAPAATGPSTWLRRWDLQQELHIPDREERFAAIAEVVAAGCGDSPIVIDLGAGPGSLSARILERIPGAQVLAIDADPVLLQIGREAYAGDDRLRFVDADLRSHWEESLPLQPPFDAAVSTTALHWLSLTELTQLYRRLAGLLRPGGLLVDGDRFDYDPGEARLAALAKRVQPESPAGHGAEDWDSWWAAVRADPAFAAAAAEQARRRHEHPHDQEPHLLSLHEAALRAAGFSETGTVWQHGPNRVLVAIR